MIILGIDPGTATTGYGLIKTKSGRGGRPKNDLKHLDHGVIKTPKGLEPHQRLFLLKTQLLKIIKKTKPDFVCIERLFFGANTKTAMSVGQARGVVMVTVAELNLPIFEYQGLSVKLKVAGNGRASKAQVQEAVRKFLNLSLKPHPDDAADALAVAIHHVIKVD